MNLAEDARVTSVFVDIVDLPERERRAALAGSCSDDANLLEDVDRLLSMHDQASRHFDRLKSGLQLASLSEEIDRVALLDPLRLTGKVVSHFRVEEYLGGGGMGIVYRARDVNLPRNVALKFLPPEVSRNPKAVARFKNEVTAASSLDHPDIAVVYEVGETDTGQLFMAMAFYDGETLKKKVGRGPLPIEDVLTYGTAIARGLAEAHRSGIIHRDVKPANIMVTRSGALKVLDFGVAKVANLSSLTSPGSAVGTISYMSPEQSEGGAVDVRTDVWSLGVTLYEMLSGRNPFAAEHPAAVIYQLRNTDPPDISSLRPEVMPELAAVVSRCLQREPGRRFSEMQDVGEALRAIKRKYFEQVQPVSVPVRRVYPYVLVAVVALLVSAGLLIFGGKESGAADTTAIEVAVLPLQAIESGTIAPAQSFVEGVGHRIVKVLGEIDRSSPKLVSIPERELNRHVVTSPADARAIFGVNRVISGELRIESPGHALVLRLIDSNTGEVLGSETVRFGDDDLAHLDKLIYESASVLLEIVPHASSSERLVSLGTVVPAAAEYYIDASSYLSRQELLSNVEAAIKLLELAIEADSEFARAHAALSEAYLEQFVITGDTISFGKAVATARRAVDLEPSLAEGRVALGSAYLARGRHAEAEDEFRRAIAMDPDFAQTHARLADVYFGQLLFDKAEESLLAAVSLEPDNWRHLNSLGRLYHRTGQFMKAVIMFRRVVDLRPLNPWGFNNVGASYHKAGDLDTAEEWYLKATRVNPGATRAVAQAHRNIGGVRYTRDDFADAVTWYTRSVEIDSTSLEGWDQLGNALYRTGDEQRAAAAWKRVRLLSEERLRFNPLDGLSMEYLAEHHAKMDDEKLALKYLGDLAKLDMKPFTAPLTAAVVYELVGDRKKALQQVKDALNNGWSAASVEASIWLDDLRKDPAYGDLLNSATANN